MVQCWCGVDAVRVRHCWRRDQTPTLTRPLRSRGGFPRHSARAEASHCPRRSSREEASRGTPLARRPPIARGTPLARRLLAALDVIDSSCRRARGVGLPLLGRGGRLLLLALELIRAAGAAGCIFPQRSDADAHTTAPLARRLPAALRSRGGLPLPAALLSRGGFPRHSARAEASHCPRHSARAEASHCPRSHRLELSSGSRCRAASVRAKRGVCCCWHLSWGCWCCWGLR